MCRFSYATKFGWRWLVLNLALLVSVPAGAQAGLDFEKLRATDMQIATVGYRFATSSVQWCDKPVSASGIQLHTLDQYAPEYRGQVQKHFGFGGPVAIEGIAPGSPAEKAGLNADDTVIQIGSVTVPTTAPDIQASGMARLIEATDTLAALPADKTSEIIVLRHGQRRVFGIAPIAACPSRFELKLSNTLDARADGEMVQITSRFVSDYSSNQVAAVLAHEFAHNILRHRVRLEERGASFGVLSGLGKKVRYVREAELQADLVSLHILRAAGYPASSAISLWRSLGPDRSSIWSSRSHPQWKLRISIMEAELAHMDGANARGLMILARRNVPLTGDWQSLVPQAAGKK